MNHAHLRHSSPRPSQAMTSNPAVRCWVHLFAQGTWVSMGTEAVLCQALVAEPAEIRSFTTPLTISSSLRLYRHCLGHTCLGELGMKRKDILRAIKNCPRPIFQSTRRLRKATCQIPYQRLML